MTHDEFIALVKQPEIVGAEHQSDLKEMVERYPYFAPARMLLTKSLQQSHSIHFGANLKLAGLYCSSRRWLYYYIHPEKALSTEPYRRERAGKSSGDYFDMIDVVEREGGDAKKTLKNLADRLKSARSMVSTTPTKPAKVVADIPKLVEMPILKPIIVEPVKPKNRVPRTDPNSLDILSQIIQPVFTDDYFRATQPDISETNAKKLIRERKYTEAIEILKQLNLNNPKKSVYFADQIRFLEKIIANSKK